MGSPAVLCMTAWTIERARLPPAFVSSTCISYPCCWGPRRLVPAIGITVCLHARWLWLCEHVCRGDFCVASSHGQGFRFFSFRARV